MNIYIVTVYDSLNYGSYWQAKVLEAYLSRYGDTYFVDIKHQNNILNTLKKSARLFAHGQIKKGVFDFIKLGRFMISQRGNHIVNKEQVKNNKDAVIFFGSDEIWNVKREKIRKSKEFFGYGFESRYKIAMAPSINRTTADEISQYDYIVKELKKFFAISVRDNHTKKVIDSLLGKKVKLISDPTLLMKKDFYLGKSVAPKIDNYLLLYTYGEMLSPSVIKNIKDFAKKEKLKIVSVGEWFDYFDKSIPATPQEFLGYVNKAKYVITDTFHGLMFSLIFQKQFFVFPCGNIKVEDTLSILGLSKRVCNKDSDIFEKKSQEIDYVDVEKRIDIFSSSAKEFIDETIEKINEVYNG